MAPGVEDEIPMGDGEFIEDQDVEAKIINEEYKTWKKNSPFLYDMILSTALEWPTLTTQWFPDVKSLPNKNFTTHRLLIGTHTSGDAPNYIQIANVELPKSIAPDERDYDEERGEIGGYGNPASGDAPAMKMTLEQKINHPGEVNKARFQPQNPNVIATMCIDGRVLIFDKSKHSLIPDGNVRPQVELIGHKSEGFGLSWNPHEVGRLATGSEDKTVRLWDLNMLQQGQDSLKPARTYRHHSSVVNDVQYHPKHQFLIGTVSDDLTVQILDVRQDSNDKSASTGRDHTDAVNALSFNPASEYLLATASADKSINLWDIRALKDPVAKLEGHRDQVTCVAWHPTEQAILGSGGIDRRVLFWDISKIGEEQMPDDVEDGPPELMFMHGGHTNHISDFSWNPNDPWVVCSAAEDNLIEIWKPAVQILNKDDSDDIPMDELEH